MNPANFENLATLREANVSNIKTYIAHEVNGKVYSNRSKEIVAPDPVTALRRAKLQGLIAPVISAVIIPNNNKKQIDDVIDEQLASERQTFNRNYKPVAVDTDEYGSY